MSHQHDDKGFLLNEVAIILVVNGFLMIMLIVLLRMSTVHLGDLSAPAESERGKLSLSLDREASAVLPVVWCVEPPGEDSVLQCVDEERLYAPIDIGSGDDTIRWAGGTTPPVLSNAEHVCWLMLYREPDDDPDDDLEPPAVGRGEDHMTCWAASVPPYDPDVPAANRTGELVVYRFQRTPCDDPLPPDDPLSKCVGSPPQYERYAQAGRWSNQPSEVKVVATGLLPLPSGEAVIWNCLSADGDRRECEAAAVDPDPKVLPASDATDVVSVAGQFCLRLPQWRSAPAAPECLPVLSQSSLGTERAGLADG